MEKKRYRQPLMKVIEMDTTDILAGSEAPTRLRIIDAEVAEYDEEKCPIPRDAWGTQW